jgi:CRISPR-associated endonuclease/helicase Cas3
VVARINRPRRIKPISGQDALLVHDAAHLEPAFQDLIVAIKKEQERCEEFGTFRVMELTATSRSGGDVNTHAFSTASPPWPN